jgi:hypothetical protein
MRLALPGLVLGPLLALGGCASTKHVCIAVTTTPPGAEVRLGSDDRIVGVSPTDPVDVEVPSSDPTVVITATKLDYTLGRKIVTMARPHDSAAEASQDVQRFHFDLSPARR